MQHLHVHTAFYFRAVQQGLPGQWITRFKYGFTWRSILEAFPTKCLFIFWLLGQPWEPNSELRQLYEPPGPNPISISVVVKMPCNDNDKCKKNNPSSKKLCPLDVNRIMFNDWARDSFIRLSGTTQVWLWLLFSCIFASCTGLCPVLNKFNIPLKTSLCQGAISKKLMDHAAPPCFQLEKGRNEKKITRFVSNLIHVQVVGKIFR